MRRENVNKRKGKQPIAIGIDERKDNSKVDVGSGEKGSKRFEIKKVENCAVVFWPDAEYVGHYQVKTATGKGLAQDLITFFEERNTGN